MYLCPRKNEVRGVAQLVSAPRSGRGGRTFESSHPDFNSNLLNFSRLEFFLFSGWGVRDKFGGSGTLIFKGIYYLYPAINQ